MLYYKKSLRTNGVIMEIKIPEIPIAKLANAPATGEIINACDVPIPCATAPNETPFAMLFLIPNILNTMSAKTAAQIPVKITTVIVNATMPPNISLIIIAIGVVTDFGNTEIINSGEVSKIFIIAKIHTKTAIMPLKIPQVIANQ